MVRRYGNRRHLGFDMIFNLALDELHLALDELHLALYALNLRVYELHLALRS